MRLFIYFSFTCVALALTACGKKGPSAALDSATATPPPAPMDGTDVSDSQSTLTITPRVPADGATTATIVMVFRNDAGQTRAGQTMKVTATGTGNVLSTCTISGDDGISRCLLTSTWAETKQVTVTNKYQWTGQATFYPPPPSGVFAGFVTGGNSQHPHGGQKLTATVGLVESPNRGNDWNGTLRLHSSFQGKIWNK